MTAEHVEAAWTVGNLAYRLRNAQRAILAAWHEARKIGRKFYIEATRRLGKSSFGLFWLTEGCIEKPGSVAMFFAPVRDGLNDYILPLIEEVFADCPEHLRPRYSANRFTLTFKNGSKILFRGSNMKQHRLRRGSALYRVFVDEARDVDELKVLITSVVLPSLFSTEGCLMISSTPADSDEHDLKFFRDLAESEGWFKKVTIWDAAELDPADFPVDRIEEFKKETGDPIIFAQEYECQWVRDPNKMIVSAWNKETMTVPQFFIEEKKKAPEFQFYRYFEAVDFGIRDKTVLLVGFYHYLDATLYVEKEIVINGPEMTTKTFGDTVLSLEAEMKIDRKVYLRVSDSDAGSQLLANDLLQSHHIAFYQTDKERLHAMVNKLNVMVGAKRVVVSTDCPFLIGSLSNCQWDDDRREFKRTPLYGHADAVAALVYLVRNLVESNPIPYDYDRQRFVPGAENVRIPWIPRAHEEKNLEVMRDALMKRIINARPDHRN